MCPQPAASLYMLLSSRRHWDDAYFSPRKGATVLYGMTEFSEAATLLARLGKHTTGKGCLYIKKLEDVDQHVLEALVLKSLEAKKARQPSEK